MRLSLLFAIRELRAGVRGFRIFLACLALGVAAVAAAGSTAEAFRAGLASQSREILGGDLAVVIGQRQFTSAELAAMNHLGATDLAVATRAMAQAPSGARRLVELRGVSANYPLAGRVELEGAASLSEALTPVGDAAGAAVEKSLLTRLGLKLGDRFLVGDLPVVARAVLVSEPDRLGRGFALGPRVLTRLSAVAAGGFLGADLPFGETARIALARGFSPERAKQVMNQAMNGARSPGGFRLRDRSEAAPGARRLIDQLEYFLGFIGLASLLAGGLGVAGAVQAFLATRTDSIAVLKALGGDGAFIRNIYLTQIGVLAALGVVAGLAAGAAVPFIVGALAGKDLPIPALYAVYPWPLAKAAAFGLLAAAAFSLTPLARARATPPAALFRRQPGRPARLSPEMLGAALSATGLAALTVATAPTRTVALVMIAGAAAAFALLWLIGAGAALAAARLRGRGVWRIALANLAGPGSTARAVAPAIGFGLALLSAVVLIQSSLLAEVRDVAPRAAPAVVFTEIPAGEGAAFDAAVAAAFGRPLRPLNYLRAPYATGRIIAVRGAAVQRDRIERGQRWAYDSDLSVSAIGAEPVAADVTAGRWWAADYAGPPLAALSTDAAAGMRVKVGDSITVSVLGRDITARVAVLRKVEFGAFGASFPLVLDPVALAGADLSDIAIAKASRPEEARVLAALGGPFPEVNVISVREQLEAAGELFDRLALAIRGAGAVAALAGLLVLAGAIAARARARGVEASILKVLGADRGQILAAYVIEYAMVGVAAALAGVALGAAAAFPVVTEVFGATWSMDWGGVGALLAGAAALTAGAGLIAALHALARRPAAALREG